MSENVRVCPRSKKPLQSLIVFPGHTGHFRTLFADKIADTGGVADIFFVREKHRAAYTQVIFFRGAGGRAVALRNKIALSKNRQSGLPNALRAAIAAMASLSAFSSSRSAITLSS